MILYQNSCSLLQSTRAVWKVLLQSKSFVSVESEELQKGRYYWGFAGILVFGPWIKQTPCCVSTSNRNSSTFTLSADEWHNVLPNQTTKIMNENLGTYIFSQFMLTFIYNSMLLPDFTESLQVRFASNTTFGAFSCRVINSSKHCLISLNAQSLRFLEKNRTL